tara:strand:- start:206 stop:472 length:267 start_codon:yes stop_codon:yes gene_type:complete
LKSSGTWFPHFTQNTLDFLLIVFRVGVFCAELNAQIKQTIHTITVQPKRIFNTAIGPVDFESRTPAHIVGTKYNATSITKRNSPIVKL